MADTRTNPPGALPVTFILLQPPQLLLREASPTPRHLPGLPAPPDRPNLGAPTANTTTQAHPGSGRGSQPISAMSYGHEDPCVLQLPLRLSPAVPDTPPRKPWSHKRSFSLIQLCPLCHLLKLLDSSLQEVRGEIAMGIKVEINRQVGSGHESVAGQGGRSCPRGPREVHWGGALYLVPLRCVPGQVPFRTALESCSGLTRENVQV